MEAVRPGRLLESLLHQYPDSWSPDGESLLFTEYRTETGNDIWCVDVNEDGSPSSKPRPLMNTPADELDVTFSPDGRWVTYSSNETGRWEVYRPACFPVMAVNGRFPRMEAVLPSGRPTAREIFYRNGDAILRVPLDLEPDLRLGSPEVVIKRDDFVIIESHPDSGKLIAIREVEGSASTQSIHVVMNFQAQPD